MRKRNAEIREAIDRNLKLFTALRRSDIAMQLRSKMVAKGVRSIDVAERLGVSEANVSRWLKGNQNLGIDTLYSLADAIEEPLTLLVGAHELVENGCAPWTEEKADWGVSRAASGDVVNMSDYREFRQPKRQRHAHSTREAGSSPGGERRCVAG